MLMVRNIGGHGNDSGRRAVDTRPGKRRNTAERHTEGRPPYDRMRGVDLRRLIEQSLRELGAARGKQFLPVRRNDNDRQTDVKKCSMGYTRFS